MEREVFLPFPLVISSPSSRLLSPFISEAKVIRPPYRSGSTCVCVCACVCSVLRRVLTRFARPSSRILWRWITYSVSFCCPARYTGSVTRPCSCCMWELHRRAWSLFAKCVCGGPPQPIATSSSGHHAGVAKLCSEQRQGTVRHRPSTNWPEKVWRRDSDSGWRRPSAAPR